MDKTETRHFRRIAKLKVVLNGVSKLRKWLFQIEKTFGEDTSHYVHVHSFFLVFQKSDTNRSWIQFQGNESTKTKDKQSTYCQRSTDSEIWVNGNIQ